MYNREEQNLFPWRIFDVFRISYILVLAACLLAAPKARADDSETEAKVEKKDEGKPIETYGLDLRLGLGSYNALNTAGEGDEWYMRYDFTLDWNFGRHYWPKSKVIKSFKAQVSFRMQNELVGTDPRFRSTSFSNPNYSNSQREYLPISDTGGYVSSSGTVDTQRVVDGAYRRVDYSDIFLTLMNTSLYEIPKAKINVDGAVRFSLPTSLQSRNKGLRTYSMLYAGLTRVFSLPKKMNLFVGYGFYWVHYFWKYDVPSIKDNYNSWEAENTGVSGNEDLNYVASSYNPSDAIFNSLWVNLNFMKKFNLYLDYTHMWLAPYQPDDHCIVDLGNGMTTNVCENTYDVRGYGRPMPWQMRASQSFTASLSYNPLPYLKVALGLTTTAPERKPDSSTLQQPFLVTNYNRYTMFMLNVTFYTSKMIQTVFKKGPVKKKEAKSLEDVTS